MALPARAGGCTQRTWGALSVCVALTAPGIRSVEAELATQSVVVVGTASTERLLAALAASGRQARLIGQGSTAGVPLQCARLCEPRRRADAAVACAGFDERLALSLGMDLRTLRQSLAAVSEFKGESWGHRDVVGVVRFVQARAGARRALRVAYLTRSVLLLRS